MSAILIPEGRQYVTDTTAQRKLGQAAITEDGRMWRYCEKSAAAAVVGDLQQSAAADANMDELVITTALLTVGAKTFFTGQTPTAVAANYLAQGYVNVESGPGAGFLYKIDNHLAIAAGTAANTINLENGAIVVWTTSTLVGVKPHPYKAVVLSPTSITGPVVGVAPLAIPASAFGWLQVNGEASVVTEDTLVLGDDTRRSTDTAGSLTFLDRDLASEDFPSLGEVLEVNATTEWSRIALHVSGFI